MKDSKQRKIITSFLTLFFFLTVLPSVAGAQGTSVDSVSPSSTAPGETVSVTITLSGDNLPPNVSSASIGDIAGSNVSWSSPDLTATFAIPSTESVGWKDVTVVFPTPDGDITITGSSMFSVLSGTTVERVYVNASGTASSPDGTSWNTAYQSLQDGIDLASLYSVELWVAKGTYKPTTGTDRGVYFELKSGATLYGGFSGSETSADQRDYTTNETILSGDIGTSGDNTDNSYHVIVGADNATLDGFTITGGYASGDPDADSDESLRWNRLGGGIYMEGVSPTITNCNFTGNYAKSGGAVYSYYYASPTFSNCTFSDNSAQFGGGILCRVAGDPVISNCTFSGNSADWRGGALFVGYGTKPAVSDTTFSDNTTDGNGAAVYVDDRSSQIGTTEVTFTTCTFSGNSAVYRGGAISNYNNATYTCITNCTFTSNTAGSGGGAIACESGPGITLVGTSTFTSNSGGTGDPDKDTDSCTITTDTACPVITK